MTAPARLQLQQALGTGLVALVLCVIHALAHAQSLPSPSRTIYKCKVKGKISFTDEPCLGAQRLDVQPTRGVSKLSGQQRIGADVSREIRREDMSSAIRQITGTTTEQFEVLARRQKLDSKAQHECRVLDQAIIEAEKTQGTAQANEEALLVRRKRYKQIGC